jgi:hypothetical protein
VRRIAKPEILEPDHKLGLRDLTYVALTKEKKTYVVTGRMEHGDGMIIMSSNFGAEENGLVYSNRNFANHL